MAVLAIWRYPVKAMLGELLERALVGAGGLDGDRRWVVTDGRTGERIANKRGPTDPRLRACRARIGAGDTLVVTLPDGVTVSGADAVAAALSDLLGRDIELAEHGGGGDRFARTSGHHDIAPLHLVSARTLARMRETAPRHDWDVRRFRPNVVLGDDGTHGDRELLGRELRAPSGLRLRVGLPTPRCVVPTRAREELPADPGLLKTIVCEERWNLGPFGRQGCVGTYAEVAEPGRLATGELVAVGERAAPTPEAAVDQTIERLVSQLG